MRARKQETDERATEARVIHEDSHHAEAPRALVTTSKAARMLGVSASTVVRKRSELGAVPGPNGYLFDEQVIREKITTIRRRQAIATLGPSTGEVASAVFGALKEGKAPADIVIEQRVAPDIVVALKKSFDEMQGSTGAHARRLCRCGSGRYTVYCDECRITLDLQDVERRVSATGQEEVRATAQVQWGRLPAKRPGRWSVLVSVELHSDWTSADSEEGRDLLEAEHRSRKAKAAGEENG
jgi:hypothetical protein